MSRHWPGLSLCRATRKLRIYQLLLGLWVETWWIIFRKSYPQWSHILQSACCVKNVFVIQKRLARCIIITYNLLTNQASRHLPVLTFRTNHSQASPVRWYKYTIKPSTLPNIEKYRKTWTIKRCQTNGSSGNAVLHGVVCTYVCAYFHFLSHVSSLTYVPLC